MDDRGWIVDASILLKWFLPAGDEADAAIARRAVGRLSMHTTSLAYFEVGSVLTRRLGLTPDDVSASLDMVEEVCGPPIELSHVDFLPAAELSSEHGLTFYDASYVAIGRRMSRDVISADSDLLAPGLAVDISTAMG